MNGKLIRQTLLFILLFELISFLISLVPGTGNIAFLIVCSIFFIIALIDLPAAILIMLVELFIGGKGYLFYFETEGVLISVRIAFFLILLSIWLTYLIRERKIKFLQSRFLFFYLALFIFFIVGLAKAFINNNGFANIFFDFNAYIFFAYLFILYDFLSKYDLWNKIFNVAIASFVWLGIKTMIVLYFFSHGIEWAVWPIYDWVRDSGVGEITLMTSNIYRVFFQSHIYSLLGVAIMATMLFLYRDQMKRLEKKVMFILLILGTAAVLISLSRSFWAGALATLPLIIIFVFYNKIKLRKLAIRAFVGLMAVIFAFLFLFIVIKFPIPEPMGGSLGSLLKERTNVADEAAAASRWNLLPRLWEGIKHEPILGQGFGAKITYISNDPRVLAYSPTGEYTTYAFEWGLLDVWYKIGAMGMFAYVVVLGFLAREGIVRYIRHREDIMALGLVVGLVVLFVSNFFTPYLNHPLGIGYIILMTKYLEK